MSTLRVDNLSSTDDAYLVPVKDLLNKSSSISSSIINLGTEADRTLADWKGEVISVKDYGAKGDGSSDDSAAFQKVFDKLAGGGHFKLDIPSGRYILSKKISLVTSKTLLLTISGAGSETTILDWSATAASSGIYIENAASAQWWMDVPGDTPVGIHFSGFTLTQRATNSGVGIEYNKQITQGRPGKGIDFYDIVWRGYSTFDSYWAKCCVLTNVGNPQFTKCRWFLGGPSSPANSSVGVVIQQNNDANPAEYYFNQCECLYGARWIEAGSNVEGIRLTNCTCINSTQALYWSAGAESGLIVIGGHYNNSNANFYLDGIFDITIVGANLYNEGRSASTMSNITIINGGRYNIAACVFNSSSSSTDTGASTGVFIANSAGGESFGGLIDSNTFHNYTDCAIALGGGSAYNTIGPGNIYRNCNSNIVDNSSPAANFIKKSVYAKTQVCTFTSAATSQAFSFDLPAGLVKDKPDVVNVNVYDAAYLVAYDYNSSTATKIIFNIRNVAATSIPSGTALRIGYVVPCV